MMMGRYYFVVALMVLMIVFTGCEASQVAYAQEQGVRGAHYHGTSLSVQKDVFSHLERYELETLYAIMFEDREYMLIEDFEAPYPEPGASSPVLRYTFVLFGEDVRFTGVTDLNVGGEDTNYVIEVNGVSSEKDLVERSIYFNVEEDGSVVFSHVGEDFPAIIPHSFMDTQDAFGHWQFLIHGQTATINYASYSTNFDGQFANRHWLMIKDYAVQVGRLTDYERILVVSVFFIGWAFVRFFKFRS